MQWITLITGEPLDLAAIARACRTIGHLQLETSPPRLTVDGTGQEPSRGFFTFIPDSSVGLAFSDQQLALIRQVLPEPHFTIVRFRRTADAEAAISAIVSSGPVLIDNDHGLLLSLDEVKHRIAMGEEWISG
jgi:hypothetical protein